MGHSYPSHRSQRRGAVFGIRANRTGQGRSLRFRKKKTLTFLNTTQTCIRNQNQLCHCFSFLTFFFFNPVIVLLPTCVLNQRMEPKKQEHATEKQIYSAADTSPHVTRRWKPRGAINYLSFIFVTSDILYIKKVKAL